MRRSAGIVSAAAMGALAVLARGLSVLALVGIALAFPAGPALAPAAAGDELSLEAIGGVRHLTLGLNKSLVIDLPRDARDVLVSNPAVADAVMRTSRRAYLIGMAVGETNVFFFDAAGNQIAAVEIEVERDLDGLARAIRQLVPGAAVSVKGLNGNIVLSGSVPTASDAQRAVDLATRFVERAEQVVSMIAVEGGEQVNLKVTVAEVRRSELKQFGIDINASLASGGFSLGALSQNPFGVASKSISATNAALGWTDGINSVTTTVRAMEQNGLLKVLAEPNLSAISGESANFLAGGEFPVPVGRDDDGNVLIDFKEFGVALAFTPVVMSEDRISLKVATEVSELTDENALVFPGGAGGSDVRIPGIKVRRADTTVELPSGGSLVLAGLIQQDRKQIINGVPGLKDVPILGALFRSRDFLNNDTELMVIVTPYMVEPVSRARLARPDDNLELPSDAATILLGRLNRLYGVAGAEPQGTYRGSFGFIVK